MAHGQHAEDTHRDDCFEIETRLVADDGTVLFSVERLERWLAQRSSSLLRWCWIIHDEDRYTVDDCLNPDGTPPDPVLAVADEGVYLSIDLKLRVWLIVQWKSKADKFEMRGWFDELKPEHIHCAVQAKNYLSFKQIAKELAIPAQYVQKSTAHFPKESPLRGKKFEAMATYQTHKDDVQRAKGKHVYPDSAVHTSGFDYTELTIEYLELKAKASASRMTRTEIDAVINDTYAGKISVSEVIEQYGYAFYHAHMKAFDDARQAFLASDAFEIPSRTSIYIGPESRFAAKHPDEIAGIGKSKLAKRIGLALTPDLPESAAVHTVTDLKVAFDRYVEQPTIIFTESRPGGFMSILGRETTFNILEDYPDKSSTNIKFGDKVLVNRYNIVNGIQPWKKFLDGLAGEYVDKHGEHHPAEARTQAYRRFALVIAVTPTAYDVYVNKGILTRDERFFTSFMRMAHGEVRVSRIITTYGGEAFAKLFTPVVNAVVEQVNQIVSMRADYIMDVGDILPEDEPVITFYDQDTALVIDADHPDGWYPDNPGLEAERLARFNFESDETWLLDRYEYFSVFLPTYADALGRMDIAKYLPPSFEEWRSGQWLALSFGRMVESRQVNRFDGGAARFYRLADESDMTRGYARGRLINGKEPFETKAKCLGDRAAQRITEEIHARHKQLLALVDDLRGISENRARDLVKFFDEYVGRWEQAQATMEPAVTFDPAITGGISIDSLFDD